MDKVNNLILDFSGETDFDILELIKHKFKVLTLNEFDSIDLSKYDVSKDMSYVIGKISKNIINNKLMNNFYIFSHVKTKSIEQIECSIGIITLFQTKDDTYILTYNPIATLSYTLLVYMGIFFNQLDLDLTGYTILDSYLYITHPKSKDVVVLIGENAEKFQNYCECVYDLSSHALMDYHDKMLDEIPIEQMPEC